jgi:hypothetical protein
MTNIGLKAQRGGTPFGPPLRCELVPADLKTLHVLYRAGS